MFYGIKRVKNRLSERLTGIYSLLFAIVLFLLSVGVFFAAFHFLLQKQTNNLRVTTELIHDHLIEEIEENESLANSEMLQEQNNDPYLSIYIYAPSGKSSPELCVNSLSYNQATDFLEAGLSACNC